MTLLSLFLVLWLGGRSTYVTIADGVLSLRLGDNRHSFDLTSEGTVIEINGDATGSDWTMVIERRGLTPAEFGVIEALYHKGPLLLGDVQRRTLISSGGTTFLIDRLEKKGLVERRLCTSDRRARYAALTTKGRELLAEIFPVHAEAIRRAMAGLGLADQRAMTDLLRTLGQEAAALSLPG